MSVSYQNKTFVVNTSTNTLVSSNGSKVSTPDWPYKSQVKALWYIQDASGTGIDLTGATFELKIAGTYNSNVLVTVSNASFTPVSIATGVISCIVDMDKIAVRNWVDLEQSKPVYTALWMTLGGVDYCLASFSATVSNLVF